MFVLIFGFFCLPFAAIYFCGKLIYQWINRAAIEAARKLKEEQQRREDAAAAEAIRVQREKERIENERLEAIRLAEEAEIARQAAEVEKIKKLREKDQAALTPTMFDEFETLSKIYPTALKYQKMTVNAKVAMLAGDLDLAWAISAQRHALQYTLENDNGVEDMLNKLLELKHGLLTREVVQRNDVTSSVSFEYAEICLSYLGKIQKLVGSRVDAGDLQIIPWSELSPYPGPGPCLLGEGQNGSVYKLRWSNQPVAVKIVSQEKCLCNIPPRNYDVELLRSVQEAERVVDICNRGGIGIDELVVKVYGFVEGPITRALSSTFDLPVGDKAFGIVMRLEAGGTLRERLHPATGMPQMPLTMTEKLRFIQQITQGLFELHKMGVIHADLKPANALLNSKSPPDCRLADFGQSFVREDAPTHQGVSTFQHTSAARGTPVYNAPEMLTIYDNDEEGLAGKSSRSTDVYALGIMMHEILSMQEPFKGLSEVLLARKVCGDGRPPLDQLPTDTPPAVRALMEQCWDGDRNNRPSAAECSSVMTHTLSVIESSHFDIFFSYSDTMKSFVVHLFDVLTKLGYRIWLDQNNMGHNKTASMQKGIEQSTVTMSFVDQSYQQSNNRQAELQHTRNKNKPAVIVIVEGNFWTWSTDAFKELCDVKTKMFADLSEVACQAWDDPDKVDSLLDTLAASTALQDVLKILKDLDCRPSIAHMGLNGSVTVATSPIWAPSTSTKTSLFHSRPKRSKVYIGDVAQSSNYTITLDDVNDPAKALTPTILREYQELSKIYPLIVQYEPITERAKEVFRAGQIDEFKRLGVAREALQYSPSPAFSIAIGRSRLVQLQGDLTGQWKKLLKELHSPQSIESGVACSLYLDKVQEMLNSKVIDLSKPLRVDLRMKDYHIYADAAITTPSQEERTYLTKHYTVTLQYDTLTQAARQAHDAGQWSDMRKIGAQRSALNYVPLSGFTVASGRTRLEALRTKVEQRRQTHLDALQMPENIDYVVACTDCLDEVKGLLDLGLVSRAAPPQVSSVSNIFDRRLHACFTCAHYCRRLLHRAMS